MKKAPGSLKTAGGEVFGPGRGGMFPEKFRKERNLNVFP